MTLTKQLKARINKIRQKTNSRDRDCYFDSCNQKAIRSHILQKNGMLNCISENSFLFGIETNLFNEDLFKFKRYGINEYFTFKGFCNYHDTLIFKKIEQEEIDIEDYETQLLFSYRAIMNEKRIKENVVESYNISLNDKFLTKHLEKEQMLEFITNQKLALTEGKYYIENILYDIENKNSIQFEFIVRELPKIPVCSSAIFTFESVEELQKLQKINKGPIDWNLTAIFFHLLPFEDETILLMGYPTERKEKCNKYFNDILNYSKEELLIYISHVLIFQCETWACSPSFYKEKIEPKKDEYINLIHLSMQINDDRTVRNINMFD